RRGLGSDRNASRHFVLLRAGIPALLGNGLVVQTYVIECCICARTGRGRERLRFDPRKPWTGCQCRSWLCLKSRGDIPKCSRKTRPKCERSLKPQANAISLTWRWASRGEA